MKGGALSVALLAAASFPVGGATQDEDLPLGTPAAFEHTDSIAALEVAEDLELRTEPDWLAPTLGVLPAGSVATVLERRGHWMLVSLDAESGWCFDPAAPKPTRLRHGGPEVLERLRALVGPAETRRVGPIRVSGTVSDRRFERTLERAVEAVPLALLERLGLATDGEGEEVLLLVPDSPEWRELSAELGAGHLGFATFGVAAVSTAGERELVRATVVHEVTHLLLRRAFAGEPPRWLDEAIAEDLAWSRSGADGAVLLGTLRGRSATIERADEATQRLGGGRAALEGLARRWRPGRPTVASVIDGAEEQWMGSDAGFAYALAVATLRAALEVDEAAAQRVRTAVVVAASGSSLGAAELLEALSLDEAGLDQLVWRWLQRR